MTDPLQLPPVEVQRLPRLALVFQVIRFEYDRSYVVWIQFQGLVDRVERCRIVAELCAGKSQPKPIRRIGLPAGGDTLEDFPRFLAVSCL